jgi:CRISPR system Cascade subunit CasC
MSDSNFLNLHVLVTTSIANMNRDDAGAPKQVTYGAATRHRMSSQAMTRAKRVAYELAAGGDQITWRAKSGMIDLALRQAGDLAAQSGAPLDDQDTSRVQVMLATGVEALVINRDKAVKAATERARAKAEREAKTIIDSADAPSQVAGPTEAANATGKKDTLVWLAEHELLDLVQQSLSAVRGGAEPKDFVNAAGRTQSLSIAAFGRMFAFRPDLQNEAAVQRSHAFTTHAADVEPDYFTAVNDLPQLAEGSGAGHLDLNQFGGGVFYWHANVDRNQLWRNWSTGDDEAETRRRLTVFFEALLLALPSGKQSTTAPKTVPDVVLAVPASSPVALHQAFEAPVRAGQDGYRTRSLEALLDAHQRVRRFTPRQFPGDALFAGTLSAAPADHLSVQDSLDELIAACVDWILVGQPTTAAG